MRYAANTDVPIDRSKADIERIVARFGADQFMSAWDGGKSLVMFRVNGRMVRFVVDLPLREEFVKTPTWKRTRRPHAALLAWEQACRQRWRALGLIVKAKLEAVESGIVEFESEFLAHIVLPNNTTVGEFMRPQIALAYERGKMPKMLPAFTDGHAPTQ